MSLPWYDYVLGHYLGGITLSIADRTFSENSKRNTSKRLEKKLGEVEALEYLVTNDNLESIEYADAVRKAKNYFDRESISYESSYENIGLMKRLAKKTSKFVGNITGNHERINNLSTGKKYVASLGICLGLDAIIVVSQATMGIGNAFSAAALTLPEAVAMSLGMQTGKAFLYVKDMFTRSKEEKELDSLSRELTEDGKLLQIVKDYSQTSKLEPKCLENTIDEQKQLPKYYSSDIGTKVGSTIVNTAENISGAVSSGIDAIKNRMRERRKTREDEEKARREALKKPYENY